MCVCVCVCVCVCACVRACVRACVCWVSVWGYKGMTNSFFQRLSFLGYKNVACQPIQKLSALFTKEKQFLKRKMKSIYENFTET